MRFRQLSVPFRFPGCLGAALLVAAAACDSPVDPAEVTPDPSASMAAEGSTADVVDWVTGEVLGTSRLVRNDAGVSMTYRSSGLEPGTVATIWWIIWNDPEECEGGTFTERELALTCVVADLLAGRGDPSLFYATGHVIGGSGRANYGARLPVGRLTVDPDEDANQLIIGDGILKDARGAVVHVALRTHGPAIPGLIDQMLNTFNAGCPGAPPALQGPNTCANIQFAAHE